MSYQVTKGMVFRPVSDSDHCFIYKCPQCDGYFMLEDPESMQEDMEELYFCPYCRYEEDRLSFLMHANYEFFFSCSNDIHSKVSFATLYKEFHDNYKIYFSKTRLNTVNCLEDEDFIKEQSLLSEGDTRELNELFPSIYIKQEYQSIFYKQKEVAYFSQEVCPYKDFKIIIPVCCERVFKYREVDQLYEYIDLIYCPYCDGEITPTPK